MNHKLTILSNHVYNICIWQCSWQKKRTFYNSEIVFVTIVGNIVGNVFGKKTYRIWLVEGPNLVSIVVNFLREDLLPFSVEFMEI